MLATLKFDSSVSGQANQAVVERIGEGLESHVIAVPAGRAGVLTTRTDDNTGTVTLENANVHFADTDPLEVYWAGGRRIWQTVFGAPTDTTLVVDGGSGDVLPAEGTAVVLGKEYSLDLGISGYLIKAFVLASTQRAYATFLQGGFRRWERELLEANEFHLWNDGDIASPFGWVFSEFRYSNGGTEAATLQWHALLLT